MNSRQSDEVREIKPTGETMIFEIRYTKLAYRQLKQLRAFDRAAIIKQIDSVLTKSPTVTSKARVKQLRQPAPTEYRLRVGDHRIFDNVTDAVVQVIQILSKADSFQYLRGTFR